MGNSGAASHKVCSSEIAKPGVDELDHSSVAPGIQDQWGPAGIRRDRVPKRRTHRNGQPFVSP